MQPVPHVHQPNPDGPIVEIFEFCRVDFGYRDADNLANLWSPFDFGALAMDLADVLRRCVLDDRSISEVSRKTGVPQPTLQEFAVGKSDGSYADLRLSSAQRLIDHYGFHAAVVRNRSNENGVKRMRLADELRACEIQDSPEKFRERLIENLMDQFPEVTIDDLVCAPTDALEFCNTIREGYGSEYLSDTVILKSLMNIRKRKDCPKGLKSRGRRRVLKKELLNAGCYADPDTFKELVVDLMNQSFGEQTVDELVCQPREARMLCNAVREKAECNELPDDLILGTLMNVRKAAGN